MRLRVKTAMFGALIGTLLAGILGASASTAGAAPKMSAIAEDTGALFSNPTYALSEFRTLGVDTVRLTVHWHDFEPRANNRKRPHGWTVSKESDPKSYSQSLFSRLDLIIDDAQREGVRVELNLSGPGPLWAAGPTMPKDKPHTQWDPSASDFGAWVKSIGKRYGGNFTPTGASTALPRIKLWSVWSEPNLGYALAPQGVPGKLSVENSGRMYRNLLNAAWTGLHQSDHGNDTILFGEVAPRGITNFGLYQAMKPLQFVRALYCVDSHLHQLRGKAASERGCPTTAAASRKFRSQNPALFQATGFADHMWDRWYPPDKELQPDPDYTSLAEIGGLIRTLDVVTRVYGSHKKFPIYNTEFGYITDPPNRSVIRLPGLPKSSYPSPKTAAYYLNWAEYISWRNPRIVSFDQYLLADPPPTGGAYVGWSSGLLTYSHQPKLTYNAWRLPLYLPVTSLAHGHNLEVWGCGRPAHYGILDTGNSETVDIRFQPSSGGGYTTLKTVTISDSSKCYFDVHVNFPGPGNVQLSYTYPSPDALLPAGTSFTSRTVQISSH
jgi:hypothetical protein